MKEIDGGLSENILNTVGCAYELIVIDNSENKYSIFEAYNLGIERSTGDYLCFMHDDIILHSIGWGTIIHRIFTKDPQIGLIGVAGSTVKTKVPSAWWDCTEDEKVINIIQHFPTKEKEKWNFGFENGQNTEVVAIDGVFMVMQRDKQMYFNTDLKGFHNYDLNISFECKKRGFKIIATNEIVLEHLSIGVLNEAWVGSTYTIHQLYKEVLPLMTEAKPLDKKAEAVNAKRFLEECLKYSVPKITIAVWMQFFCLRPFTKYHIRVWKKIIKAKLRSL
jgi:glycosyltransferase involved in cell wall biosynthesis